MGARADRLNRFLLSLLGLVLLAIGVLGLLPALGVFGAERSDDRVLSPDVERYVADEATWLWPLVAVVLIGLALLALRWLIAQLRTDRVDDLDLTADRTRGETHVDPAAVTGGLVHAVERCPGVDGAHARIVRSRGRRQLLLQVRLADRADARDVRRALADGPLSDLGQVLGGLSWPEVHVDLEPSTRGTSRTVA